MSLSLWVLSALIILIMFGAGQRIIDQMRLNDKQAILVLIAMVVGILIPPIYVTEYFCFSIGGFLIPFIICLYMLFSAGLSRDLIRAVVGTILVAGIIYGLEWLMPSTSAEDIVIEPMYVYGVVAGVVAYALGRSRRNAFISCVFGISLAMLIQFIVNMSLGTPTVLGLGVGGAFGTIIISTTISVALCEFLGRAFETAQKDEDKKVFNFETHTYDSEKNGKLNSDGSKAIVIKDKNGEINTSSNSKFTDAKTRTITQTNKNTKSVANAQKLGSYDRHNTENNNEKLLSYGNELAKSKRQNG